MIPFNVPPFAGESEYQYMRDAIESHKICGDGKYTGLCSRWMEQRFGVQKVLLTTSCTTAEELAAMLLKIGPGDEVICPSYTFVSSANPFVLRGATLVFVDIRPDTMNIDETRIEEAITPKTKAIMIVHYAGIACEMDAIMEIANRHHIPVIEDAAHAFLSTYHGKPCGTFGTFGCFSFHETKNYSMGEGGAILLNDPGYTDRAEIIREKGTNRSQFYRGQVDKYTWQDVGSSLLPSDILAAYLWAQLEIADQINENRLASWNQYRAALEPLRQKGMIELPTVPVGCVHNAHMFYLKCRDLQERTALIDYLKKNDILAVFHYIPLHSSPEGMRAGRFSGEDRYTSREADRLVRLPLYYQLKQEDLNKVIDTVYAFYGAAR